ncbi:class I SAM-dependent methyltransferase [Trichocoleus sp. FACHB-591]|uniref:class I SAM-dependent methyltransferase n=1 Tax=Trichocoleus sp. FACHB-591 TaxID=2692872 RepID=UPI001681ECC0|nr:class I SAM-dependent methyltransferase [Trichocoleus sp. FACHB-591]MBD2093611.1 class I SAM-dependent methyltransferase [Trichocoleus sp. FACHB-591]
MSVSGISDRSLLSKALVKRAIAFLVIIGLGLWLTIVSPLPAAASADVASVYQQRDRHRSDGIGKIYMGREIAQVMGHQGAAWLERSSRSWEEQPQRVVEALDLQPSDVVADIGAGTGYFSFRLSPLVPTGKVLAVDVQPEMIEILNFLKQENQATNVEPVLGTVQDPHLPVASVDLALMVDAYHEFEYPQEMMTALVRSLKLGGRVVLVEYRGENPLIAIKALHKMTQRQVKKEMQAVGLVWQETKNLLPQQHLMIFRKLA